MESRIKVGCGSGAGQRTKVCNEFGNFTIGVEQEWIVGKIELYKETELGQQQQKVATTKNTITTTTLLQKTFPFYQH